MNAEVGTKTYRLRVLEAIRQKWGREKELGHFERMEAVAEVLLLVKCLPVRPGGPGRPGRRLRE